MRKGSVKKSLIYSIIFFVTSCVTINIYFPAAAVEKAADKIVDEVWGEGGRQQPEDEGTLQKEEPRSSIMNSMRFAISLMGPDAAYAQDADINITTPAIRTLKESIKQRSESIKPFMDSGNAGIGNDGLIVIRNSDGLNLKDKARLIRLIAAENDERNALYSEIAKANKFSPDKIPDIKSIFAGSWIDNARSGWWIQDSGGNWKQK